MTDFYRAVAEKTQSDRLKKVFFTFEEANLKRRDSLIRARREMVVEMSLEPITGLKLGEYGLHVRRTIGDENLDDLQKAIALETVAGDIYARASAKISSISADAGELLNRLCEESSERRRTLAAAR